MTLEQFAKWLLEHDAVLHVQAVPNRMAVRLALCVNRNAVLGTFYMDEYIRVDLVAQDVTGVLFSTHIAELTMRAEEKIREANKH